MWKCCITFSFPRLLFFVVTVRIEPRWKFLFSQLWRSFEIGRVGFVCFLRHFRLAMLQISDLFWAFWGVDPMAMHRAIVFRLPNVNDTAITSSSRGRWSFSHSPWSRIERKFLKSDRFSISKAENFYRRSLNTQKRFSIIDFVVSFLFPSRNRPASDLKTSSSPCAAIRNPKSLWKLCQLPDRKVQTNRRLTTCTRKRSCSRWQVAMSLVKETPRRSRWSTELQTSFIPTTYRVLRRD